MKANMNNEIYKKVEDAKLLPLYTATDMQYLDKAEEILLRNNVPLIEITFRSNLAVDAINYLAKSGKLIVGSGTVKTVEEAKMSIDNGASFVVCPAVSEDVIEYCINNNIPVFPGTVTPTDIQKTLNYGINIVKFFPANVYGGLEAINALSGPFYDVKFLPTGGVNNENLLEYLNNDAVIGVGGSFILSEKLIAKDDGVSADNNLKEIVQLIND